LHSVSHVIIPIVRCISTTN